ncbi:hypothetical protein CRM22_006687 [Opisthorchis felineus]|uniref:Uncharacterized protein n=1 Tax=Opisthorchis felineus TaxID=147828 RepID=A0A4S2LSL2_OPIFE|nr:hypothetical protein CRM22_006687 [Opisthorchis felineus]
MALEVQRAIAANFDRFATLFSPSLNGGLLNYIFQPVVVPGANETLLTVPQVTGASFTAYLSELLLRSNENYPVIEVLPQNVQPTQIQVTFYPVQIALGIIAFLVTFCMLIVLIVAPCRYYTVYKYRKNRQKHKTQCTSKTTIIEELETDKNHYEAQSQKLPQRHNSSIFEEHMGISVQQSRWYLGLGIAIGVSVLFIVLCTPFVYISLDAAVVAISGNSNTGLTIGLEEAIKEAFAGTISFLQNLPTQGSAVTSSLLERVQTDLVENLHILIRNILEQLLKSYGARLLIDQVGLLKTDVDTLQNVTSFVAQSQQGTLADISYLQGKVVGYKNALSRAFETLCPKVTSPGAATQCTRLKADLEQWNTDFSASTILVDPSITLSELTAIFGVNVTQLLGEFDKLEAELDRKANEVVAQIEGNFNLTEQFQALNQLWDEINTNIGEPAVRSVNQISPIVISIVHSTGMAVAGLGYLFLIICTLALLVIIIYIILLATEAYERDLLIIRKDLMEEHCYENTMSAYASIPHTFPPSTHHIKCGIILSAILCSTIPLVVLVGGATILLASVGRNEACRYSSDPSGLKMTDEALNLYIRYIWPDLIANQSIDPSILDLLNLPTPKDVVDGLLVKCKQTGSSPQPGLLPSVGVDQLVNVTAVIEQPRLQESIDEAENTLVTELLKFDFASLIPGNVDELFATITNITSYLDNSDYTASIAELRKSLSNNTWISDYADQLLLFVTPYLNQYPEALTIRTTVEAIQSELKKTDEINTQIRQLIQAFEILQLYRNFTIQLRQLEQSLKDLIQTLKNPASLEAPIRPTYRENLGIALRNLTALLNVATSQFTKDVITCGSVNTIAVSVVGATCGNDGIISRLGGFCFTLLLLIGALLLTVLAFQFFLCLHEHHCLYATNQGIPLHLFVKFVYRHLAHEYK